MLRLGAGARPSGLGEAYVAAAREDLALFWNPAGLGYTRSETASFMHAVWFESISYDVLSAAVPVPHLGALGLGIQYLSWGSFESLDNGNGFTEEPRSLGRTTPRDLAATLGWGTRFGTWALGFSGKFFHSKIDAEASTWSADLGIQKTWKSYAFGVAVQNATGSLKFNRAESKLPFLVKVGAALPVSKRWLWVLDLNLPEDNSPWIAFGSEFSVRPSPSWRFAGRAGYNTRSQDTQGLNGVTLGLGLGLGAVGIDYAFVPFGMLGNTHRVSVNFRWGDSGPSTARRRYRSLPTSTR